jgi:hypothetical protein
MTVRGRKIKKAPQRLVGLGLVHALPQGRGLFGAPIFF